MRTLKYISFFILMCCLLPLQAQKTNGKYGTFALTNGSIETVTKGIINNGTVIIRNGNLLLSVQIFRYLKKRRLLTVKVYGFIPA